ncbi:MAG: hypothetical protein QRY74_05845 [Chlamydia sp.]
MKSERLRKLESELQDLEQWLQLGLVPKKDLEKHKEEIQILQLRIEEEKERLQFLKDGGEPEEYVIPKRTQGKPGYSDMPTIPDIDMSESSSGMTESSFDMETYISDESTLSDERDTDAFSQEEYTEVEKSDAKRDEDEDEDEDESYFSDRNRWRRGGIVDPDADEW